MVLYRSSAEKIWTLTHEEPSSFETLGFQFSILGDTPNWESDPKSEFSGTESLYPDPCESQICLLGMET